MHLETGFEGNDYLKTYTAVFHHNLTHSRETAKDFFRVLPTVCLRKHDP